MQGILQGQCNCFNVMTLPPQVTNLVLSQSPATITGSFNGVDIAYPNLVTQYVVVYKAGGVPTGIYDGTSITIQPQGLPIYTFTISGLSNGVSYGVRVFVRGPEGFQTSEIAQGTITPVAGLTLSSLADGVNPATIKLTEGGSGVNFLVLKHNYQSSGRTLVLRIDLLRGTAWNSTLSSAYANSDIDLWLNGDYLNLLDSNIRNQISAVTIPYTIGNGNKTLSTLSRKVFLLSYTEVGFPSNNYANIEGSQLAYFNSNTRRVALLDGTAYAWWTRSPEFERNYWVWVIGAGGVSFCDNSSIAYPSRPAFTLPANMLFQTKPNSDGSYSPM